LHHATCTRPRNDQMLYSIWGMREPVYGLRQRVGLVVNGLASS
jgi:hypothetical protein